MVLSVLPIQTIEYLCSQEYSRFEGLSGDHLVQAFSGSRNFDQIAWDLFSFEFSQKLGGPCVLPLLTRVFPWETFFFQISSFFFLLLEPVHSTASRSARSLFLFFIPYGCILEEICLV